MQGYCYLNGKIVQEKYAVVSPFDSGLLYGDGVFETIRVHNGSVVYFEEHLERLRHGLEVLNIKCNIRKIKSAVLKLLNKSKEKDCIVRITITRGNTSGRLPWEVMGLKPTVFISLRKIPDLNKVIKNGVSIIFLNENQFQIVRQKNPIKTISYQHNVLGRIYAKKQGAFEAIFVNNNGYVTEGTSTNLFFIRDGILHTPSLDLGILPGVTRQAIIDTAKSAGIKVKEGKFTKNQVLKSESVFLTNAVYGIIPIRSIDGIEINDFRMPFCKQPAAYQWLLPSIPYRIR